jgi:tRNA A-37 threonylcarbamoyl transferase component Bud32
MSGSCAHTPATSLDGTAIGGLCPRCLVSLALDYGDDGSQLTPGLIINDRFRINALAGRGGMGEVYRADDLMLGQVVALKFVPSDSEEEMNRLRNEVRLGRQVSHPNVCRLYELLQYDGRHFVVMEFIEGEDLAALMKRIGRLPTPTALTLGREICAALTAAHERGVVHGDLKPSNVMVDGHGHARITDFGLSTFGGGHEEIAGTPAYMAPEQLRGTRSTATDIYALGVVLLEMFGGEPKRVPSGMREVVSRCLSVDPAARPATARNVLAAFPGGDLLDAALAAGDTRSPELVAAADQVQPLPLKGSIAVLAGAIAFLGVAATVRLRPPSPSIALDYNVYLSLLPVLLVAGVFAARRNIRMGRVDARGAWRIALWVMACRSVAWLFDTDHVASLSDESRLAAEGLGRSLFSAAQAWLGYLAAEPYIRRRRPQTIIGWRRLLDGKLADPIVGRDVLIGVAVGAAMVLVAPRTGNTWQSTIAMIFYVNTRAIFYAVFGLFLLTLLRSVFRPRIIGSVAWLVLATGILMRSSSVFDAVTAALLGAIVFITLRQFGLLATIAALFAFLSLTSTRVPQVTPVVLLLGGLAIAGFLTNRK